MNHIKRKVAFSDKGIIHEGSEGKEWSTAPLEVQRRFMQELRSTMRPADLREKNMEIVWKKLGDSVDEDVFLSMAIKVMREEEEAFNRLMVRLREWFEWYDADLSRKVGDHERFLHIVLEDKWQDGKNTFVRRWHDDDVRVLKSFASSIESLSKDIKQKEEYLSRMLKRYAPNVLALTNAKLAAQLLEHAGGLRKMAFMPSSTIQLLGAEKALFRHLRTGAKSPKHGIIIQHPLLANSRDEVHGKIARLLADRLSMAARLDFFKGEFKGDMYRRELEETCKKL
jgi:nucleolar protein 56